MGGDKYEEYYLVDVLNSRVMNDTNLLDTMLRIAYARCKNENYNAKTFLRDLSNSGANQILNYYNMNKWYNSVTFPANTVSAISIPELQLKAIIEEKEGKEVFISSYRWDLLTLTEWVNYRLQEIYGYLIYSPYLYIDKWYRVGTNHSITTYDLKSYAIPDFSSVLEITEQIRRVTTIEVEETAVSYLVTTTIADTRELVDTARNSIIMDEKVPDEVTIAIIQKPAERPEESVVTTIINVDETTQTSTVVTTNIVNSPLVYSYIVNYTVDGVSKLWVYFPTVGTNIDLGQTNIPTLYVPQGTSSDVELFPITVLRHNYYFVNEYDGPPFKTIKVSGESSRFETVWKPHTVTQEQYESTKYILGAYPLDIDFLIQSLEGNPDLDFISDAFFMMGIDPFDTHPMTSKLLFESFRYYDIVPEPIGLEVSSSQNGNFIVFRDPFNLQINWSSGFRQFMFQVGEEGTYSHTIYPEEVYLGETCETNDGETTCKPVYETQFVLDMRHQVTSTIVERILIRDITGVTTIGRQKAEGVVDNLATEGLIFPLPYTIVESFTPIDKILVLERTLRILIYAGQNHYEYLEWYQRGVFQVILSVIMAIILVVVAVVTAGAGASLAVILSELFLSFTIGVGITVVMKIAGTLWGDEVPWIESLVAAVAIVVMVMTGYIDPTLLNAVITAVDLTVVAMQAVTSIIESGTQEMLDDHLKTSEEYQKVLDSYTEISDSLGGYLDPVELSSLNKTLALIKPSDYYDISFNLLHNYDLLFQGSYDNVKSYYKNSLQVDKQYSYT